MGTSMASSPARQAMIALDGRVPAAGGLNMRFVYIEMKRLLRNKRTVIFTLLLPAVFFLAFGLPNVNEHPAAAPDPVAAGRLHRRQGAVLAVPGAAVRRHRVHGRLCLWYRQGLVDLAGLRSGGLAGISHLRCTGTVYGLFGALPERDAAAGPDPGGPAQGGLFVPLSAMGDTFGKAAAFTAAYGIGQLARSPLTGEIDWAWVLNMALWLAVFTMGAALAFRRDT